MIESKILRLLDSVKLFNTSHAPSLEKKKHQENRKKRKGEEAAARLGNLKKNSHEKISEKKNTVPETMPYIDVINTLKQYFL